MSTKILVVDDDVNICEAIKLYLVNEGYDVKTANDGDEGIKTFKTFEPDLVLLDIMMPKKDGKQTCREIREISNKPIIMVTAKDEVFDKVLLLELGADDYLVKPFDMKELSVRIKSVLRRYSKDTTHGIINVKNIKINTKEAKVYKDNNEIILTAMEYKLLLSLIKNRGKVLSRTALLENLWDIDGDFIEDNTLTVYIKRLRDKIEEEPNKPAVIKTVRGLGYIVDND